MAKLQKDLSEFVGLLISRKVEFLVVGGHAVAFHGHARFAGALGVHRVHFLGWEDLLTNKRASGRDKDQLDVKILLKIAAQKKQGR